MKNEIVAVHCSTNHAKELLQNKLNNVKHKTMKKNIYNLIDDAIDYYLAKFEKDERINKKIVLYPIEVPDNDFCYNGQTTCQYFDNTSGCGICELDVGIIKEDSSGYYSKPNKCKKFKNY